MAVKRTERVVTDFYRRHYFVRCCGIWKCLCQACDECRRSVRDSANDGANENAS